MKKTCLTALLFVLAAAAASAQEGRAARLAVVDPLRVSSESLMGKGYAARLQKLEAEVQALMTEKQAELGRLDAAIQSLNEELQKQGSVLSDEAREKKQQEITRKTRERAAFVEDGQAELNRKRERAAAEAQTINNEFQSKLRPLVELVAREQGVDIVIPADAAVWADGAHDITARVIAKADAAEQAKPAATPTTAPKP